MEEAGVDLDNCEIIAKMDDVFPGNLSIRVTPFVVIASEAKVVEIDHREIAEYFWISLDFFSSEKNSTLYTFSRFGRTIQTPSFVIPGKHVVWGMTLRIILNLLSELGQFSREAP